MAGKRQTNRPWGHRRAEAQPVPRTDGEAGETLIEVLLSVMLTGVMVVAVLGGLLAAVNASAVERRAATSEVVINNFAEALADAPYVACAAAADYTDPPNFDPVAGYTVTVDPVLGWVEDSDPTDFVLFEDDCSESQADTGLQEISFTVTAGDDEETRSHSVLKRYNGTIDDLDQPLPAGGVRCTVVADRDTVLDQADADTPKGSDVTMDLVGIEGARRESLVRFDLSPDEATCLDGTTVPAGMTVLSASLRLYTWEVSGIPDCDTECNHQLHRLTSPWTEGSTTWSTDRPTRLDTATADFNHGADALDGPRHQTITTDHLRSDVALFYVDDAVNEGWSIAQDCGPSESENDCTSPAPGFRMRTREWSDARQRPTLTVVFAPDNSPGKHLQNVLYRTCVSIKDSSYGWAQDLVSGGCAGRRNQLWVHPSEGSGGRAGQFRAGTTGYCMETGQESGEGATTAIYDCHDSIDTGNWQKWDIDGSAIRYRLDDDMCLAATAKPRGEGPPEPLGEAIVIQGCNGSPEQQWVFEAPPAYNPQADIRLTALDTEGLATGDCADVDVRWGSSPITESEGIRWAQSFPCLGDASLGQTWNPLPDGRLVNRLNPGFCLGYDDSFGYAGVESCGQGDNQIWIIDGMQLRNLKKDQCLSGTGGRHWLTMADCGENTVPAGQAWQIDPATEPASAEIVQLRNAEYDNCMDGGEYLVTTWPCGETGRTMQSFIKLTTNELAFRNDPSLCLSTNGTELTADTCVQVSDENVAPPNTWQQWIVNSSSQLVQAGTTKCAQGNGGMNVGVTQPDCLTGDELTVQQWSIEEELSTTSSVRQMRIKETNRCADMPSDVNATASPCSGPDRVMQGVFLLHIGDEVEIRLASSPSQCIDVQSGGSEGAAVMAIDCNNGEYQRWALSGAGQLKTKSPNGLCLQGGADSAILTMRDCTSADNQQWVFEAPKDLREPSEPLQFRSANRDDGCLDVDGATGTNFENNDEISVLPCLGAARTNQSFLLLGNGQIQSSTTPGQCLDAAWESGATVRPVLYACDATKNDQRWVIDADSRIQNVTTSGDLESEQCIQGGLDGARVTLADCSNSADQQWVKEDLGANVRADTVGRLSTSKADLCLDTNRAHGDSSLAILGRPCMFNRSQQRFVRLNSGQYRPVDNLGFCIDAHGGVEDDYLRTKVCATPTESPWTSAQQWNLDDDRGWLWASNSEMCATTNGSGLAVLQKGCLADGLNNPTDPNQQWTFEPGAGL